MEDEPEIEVHFVHRVKPTVDLGRKQQRFESCVWRVQMASTATPGCVSSAAVGVGSLSAEGEGISKLLPPALSAFLSLEGDRGVLLAHVLCTQATVSSETVQVALYCSLFSATLQHGDISKSENRALFMGGGSLQLPS